jgi:hypothetical protein
LKEVPFSGILLLLLTKYVPRKSNIIIKKFELSLNFKESRFSIFSKHMLGGNAKPGG